jgi:hypothetical protein
MDLRDDHDAIQRWFPVLKQKKKNKKKTQRNKFTAVNLKKKKTFKSTERHERQIKNVFDSVDEISLVG